MSFVHPASSTQRPVMFDAQSSSCSGFVSVLFMASSDEMFLILMQSNLSVFSPVLCAFCVWFKKFFPTLRPWTYAVIIFEKLYHFAFFI